MDIIVDRRLITLKLQKTNHHPVPILYLENTTQNTKAPKKKKAKSKKKAKNKPKDKNINKHSAVANNTTDQEQVESQSQSQSQQLKKKRTKTLKPTIINQPDWKISADHWMKNFDTKLEQSMRDMESFHF